ncbi:hypothetical protein L1887_42084 [Cichorium endivia]|nr:hypothetical protein L1887_42084 [Cichorium endivia]
MRFHAPHPKKSLSSTMARMVSAISIHDCARCRCNACAAALTILSHSLVNASYEMAEGQRQDVDIRSASRRLDQGGACAICHRKPAMFLYSTRPNHECIGIHNHEPCFELLRRTAHLPCCCKLRLQRYHARRVSQLAQGDFDAYWLSAGIAGAAAMGTAGSWSGPTVLSPVVRRMDMLGCCSSAPASAIRVRKSKAGRAFSRCVADGGPLTRRTWARRAKVGRGAQSHGVSWLARWWQGATWAGGTRRVDREMPEGDTGGW